MLRTAREWLLGRQPQDIAEKTGIAYDEEHAQFHFMSLGREIIVSYPAYEIMPQTDEWHQLVILHYMKLADGTALTGAWTSMGAIKDGLIRGGDFDRRCEHVIGQRIGQITAEQFADKCRSIGGRITDSNADLAVYFDFLPRYPMLLKLWFADEEFSASGKLLLDAGADHYLTIEDAVTAGQIVMEKLVGVF